MPHIRGLPPFGTASPGATCRRPAYPNCGARRQERTRRGRGSRTRTETRALQAGGNAFLTRFGESSPDNVLTDLTACSAVHQKAMKRTVAVGVAAYDVASVVDSDGGGWPCCSGRSQASMRASLGRTATAVTMVQPRCPEVRSE